VVMRLVGFRLIVVGICRVFFILILIVRVLVM
jgi:hypothetical protein